MRILFSLLLVASVQLLSAQNMVTFQVNMNEYTGDAFTTVNLNGDFNGWCGECAPMSDDDGDGIYSIEVALDNGTIEYKFTVDGWTGQEELTPGFPCTITLGAFTNRTADIDASTVLPAVCWEACEDCGAPSSSSDVTFRVDMSEYTGSYSVVNLNGTFNGWCGGCAIMTDDNSDGIYEITANIPNGGIDYKFTIDGWDGQENLTEGQSCTMTTDGFTNRRLEVTENIALDVVCWESCQSCGPTALQELTRIELSVMPNPTDGMIQVQMAEELMDADGVIEVLSLDGKVISTQSIASLVDGRMDLAQLSEGVYLLNVRSAQYQAVERIYVQH